MGRGPGRHCSDEQLLAWLDGELGPLRRRLVQRHLHRCWDCRARLRSLEEQIRQLTEQARSAPFPPELVEAARLRFLLWQASSGLRFARKRAWNPAAAVAACAALVLIWAPVRPESSAVAVLGAARQAPAWADAGSVVHQVMRIELAAASGTSRRLVVELYAERPHGRTAVFWRRSEEASPQAPESAGHVFPAASQGDDGGPREDQATLRPAFLLRYGTTAAGLERAVREWFSARRWRPVRLTESFAELVGDDATRLRVWRDRRQAVVVLRLWRDLDGRTVEAALTLEAATLQARSLAIRVWERGRWVKVRLVAQSQEVLPLEKAAAAFRTRVPERAARRPKTPPERMSRPRPADAVLPPIEEVEVALVAALHRARACTQEGLHPRPQPDGFVLEGVLEQSARRSEILAQLAELPPDPRIQVRLRSVEEDYAADAAPAERQADEMTTGARAGLPEALHRHLRTYFTQAHFLGAEEAERRITQLARHAVNLAELLLAEAWALRHLEEEFPPERLRRLSEKARAQLLEIEREHLQAVWYYSGELHHLLAPALAGFAHVGLSAPHLADASRNDAITDLFTASQRAADLIGALLAGSERENEPPRQLANQLLSTLEDVQRVSGAVRSRLEQQLAIRSGAAGPM